MSFFPVRADVPHSGRVLETFGSLLLIGSVHDLHKIGRLQGGLPIRPPSRRRKVCFIWDTLPAIPYCTLLRLLSSHGPLYWGSCGGSGYDVSGWITPDWQR